MPRRLRKIGRSGALRVALILLVCSGLWGFAEISDDVLEGETAAFDEMVLMSLRATGDASDPLGARWVEEMGRDFTALGGIAVLSLVTVSVAVFLALSERKRLAVVVLVAAGGGLALSLTLKRHFERPRPDLVPHGSHVYTTSFPSGHAMMSAATYLTLAAIVARAHARRRVKVYVLGLAILLTFVVGVSRIYLGVHWPTDVAAGWAAGGAWAASSWLVTHWLQLHGAVETPPSTGA